MVATVEATKPRGEVSSVSIPDWVIQARDSRGPLFCSGRQIPLRGDGYLTNLVRILGHTSKGRQISISTLRQAAYLDFADQEYADLRLSVDLSRARQRFKRVGLEVVNPVSRKERAQGIEARYFIEEENSKQVIFEAIPSPSAETISAEQSELEPLEDKGKEKAFQKDFSEEQEKIAYGLFRIHPGRKRFLSYWEIIKDVYADRFRGITDEDGVRQKVLGLREKRFLPAQTAIIEKLRRVRQNSSDVPPRVAQLLSRLKARSKYRNFSLDDLILVAEREITFEEFQKKTGLGNVVFSAAAS